MIQITISITLNVKIFEVITNPTTKTCSKTFNLASQWTKSHVSEGKAVEAGERAHGGNEEVCYSHIDQDVVQMRPELLVLKSTCNGEDVDGRTKHKQQEHEC